MASRGRNAHRARNHPREKVSASCTTIAEITWSKAMQILEATVLLESIRSLYADKLEPLDIHVRRRIEERTGNRWTPEELLKVAKIVKEIEIEEENGKRKQWLFLVGRKKDFVDQAKLHDPYPTGMWQALRSFVETSEPDWANLVQASSRYDIGKMLHERLPELRSYSLGHVCHIVQLAVKFHYILGYRDGRLVPYRHSLDFEKTSNARGQRPTGVEENEHVVRSMHELRNILSKLLVNPIYAGGIQISTLKAVIRKNFYCELNETVLGFTRLSALLSDPQLSRLGVLEMIGSEIYFGRSARPCNAIEDNVSRKHRRRKLAVGKPTPAISATSDSTVLLAGSQTSLPLAQSASLSAPLPSAGAFSWTWANNSSFMYADTVVYEPVVYWVPKVKRTFIELPLPEHERGRRRESSCPARVEGGEPMKLTSLSGRRASSEPMGRSAYKEENEFVPTMDATALVPEPMPEPA